MTEKTIYITRNEEGEVSNHIVMTRTENEEKAPDEKSPKKKSVGNYPFQFFEKNHNKELLGGRLQNQVQTAINVTEQTVTTDTGKVIHRKFISGPTTFRKKSGTENRRYNNPKNRHCLRGVDGKYIHWNEILGDVLNGKLKNVQNKRTESDVESKEGK